ncbi:chitin disaccharide deacetylase [Photobacterium ganghwense]|uniref:chitin disaccharide deacetylase n=1 Tax=Photobacterium ganghwense TaxID=320778 RepID=UPI001C2D4442|nr:chitin disaccharide deacetylase [Photobacterium ganghwense]MBV1841219.1 chitin disaccharide deacetylase [Photobacterium ganghwense]
MHVIFNADDFGLTLGVNLGIVESCVAGVVRSTTLMVGMPAEQQAVQLAGNTPALKVGVHLRFTAGSPLTAASSLVNEQGMFLPYSAFWAHQGISQQQIADETTAQIEHFLAQGLALSHVDSHHHAHTHPELLPVIEEVVQGYRVPLRGSGLAGSTCRYVFESGFYGEELTLSRLTALLDGHQGRCDVLEVMTHPALVDQSLLELSSYNIARTRELAVLTDPRLPELLKQRGITVADYSSLF